MTEAQQGELNRILNEFDEIVMEKLCQTSAARHVIDTGKSPPVQSYTYRIAPAWNKELHGEIKQLLDQGNHEPSHSSWSAPIVPIRKTNGSLRLCINYRKLTQVTVRDPYQIPSVDDLLDKVAGAMCLSKIDLKKGFYQCLYRRRANIKLLFACPGIKTCFHTYALWPEESTCHLPAIHGVGAGGTGWFLKHLHR